MGYYTLVYIIEIEHLAVFVIFQWRHDDLLGGDPRSILSVLWHRLDVQATREESSLLTWRNSIVYTTSRSLQEPGGGGGETYWLASSWWKSCVTNLTLWPRAYLRRAPTRTKGLRFDNWHHKIYIASPKVRLFYSYLFTYCICCVRVTFTFLD